jgi:hypothetical protein
MEEMLTVFEGSGKTLIAILLLKHIIQNELVDRERGQRHRISFFLVCKIFFTMKHCRELTQ